MRPLAKCCSPSCAIEYAGTVRKKREAKEHKEAKAKLKTRATWLKEAQAVFNKWVRLRDKDKPCISCGRFHQGQMHAGHYLTIGARPELRFNELNINAQCAPCNNHLSGNIVLYRQGLIAKIGIELVEWLEGHHEPKKYTIEDIKAIKAEYSKRIKGME